MNINSNNIVVFPSVNRSVAGTTHKEAVQFTELNVTQIINRIVDRDSFIVKVSDVVDNKVDITINIFGYYFDIKKLDLSSFSTSVYAYVDILNKVDGVTISYNLVGGDSNDVFTGLNIVSTVTSNTDATKTRYSLLLFKKTNNVWDVNDDALIKFGQASLGDIDLGVI